MIGRWSQFKIGLFVLAGLGIMLAGLFVFGIRRKLERKLQFETYVAGSVERLSRGSTVRLKGVDVGNVTGIGFSWIEYPGSEPPCVVVRFEVGESVSPSPSTVVLEDAVRRGLRAIVQPEGLTGPTILDLEVLDPARNPPLEYTWKPRSHVIPSAESQVSHVLESVDRTLSNLQKLDIERLTARLDHILESADAAIQKLGQLDAKRVSDSWSSAGGGARSAALELRGLARDARRTLRSMQLEALGQDADRLVLGVRESNARLERLIDRLSSIDIRDLNETLASTRQASRRLNDTIEQLNRYPSGFLLGKAPPRVQGVDKEGE